MTSEGSDDLLIRAGTLVQPGQPPRREDILVRGGWIASIGSFQHPSGVRELDASRRLVLPGLVNAHTHSGENFNVGRYENLPLDLWYVHSHDLTRRVPLDPRTIYFRTLVGALQMALSGTTTVIDFLYEAPAITEQSLDAVIRAYRDVGLRATIILGLSDTPFLQSLPLDQVDPALRSVEADPPSADEQLDLLDMAADRWNGQAGTIRLGGGPSAPHRCSRRLLQASMERAQSRDLVWHTHVHETKAQLLTALRWHGRTFVELLDEFGLLTPRCSLVHAVWLTDRDVELLAARGVTAVHCLVSNLRLADGIARLPDLVALGVRVALGTDGRGCDESLDMLELAKMTALVHKNHGQLPETWPTAGSVLQMATAAGSRPAGYEDKLGRLQEGCLADLVLLDADALPLLPCDDPVRQVVYGSASRAVRSVVVHGRVIVDEGRVPGIDVPAALQEARFHADAVASHATQSQAGEAALERLARQVWEQAEETDIGVRAYIGPYVHGPRRPNHAAR